MQTPRRTRVALYARTSTRRDQKPRMQIDELRQVAAQRGWEVVGEYVDIGQSGSKERRPELDRLMEHVHRGMVDLVACYRFDRFARSVRHLVMALDEFNARGVDFVSLHDGIDTSTPVGRFTFHVIASVAELERSMIRERVRSGLDATRRRGTTLGRPRVHVDVELARRMKAEGHKMSEIAKACGAGISTVRRELAKAAERDRASAASPQAGSICLGPLMECGS